MLHSSDVDLTGCRSLVFAVRRTFLSKEDDFKTDESACINLVPSRTVNSILRATKSGGRLFEGPVEEQ